jgi:ankyrin repeat protein
MIIEIFFNLVIRKKSSMKKLLLIIAAAATFLSTTIFSAPIQPMAGGIDLHSAVAQEQFDTVKKLVSGGADVNAQDSLGQTPFYLAVLSNNLQMIEYFLSLKNDDGTQVVNVNIRDFNCNPTTTLGQTALFHAGVVNNVKMIRMLLAAGASLEITLEGVVRGVALPLQEHIAVAQLSSTQDPVNRDPAVNAYLRDGFDRLLGTGPAATD